MRAKVLVTGTTCAWSSSPLAMSKGWLWRH